jgi:hypothetical protein
MSLAHLLIGAAIAAGVNVTLGSRRVDPTKWQWYAVHAFVVCALLLGRMP